VESAQLRSLVGRAEGNACKELLLFGGAIDAEDLRAMTQAIEDGCEEVNEL
jgi:O-acetyl-ADP-ribose deacetylase (regulator of RNase III)